MIDRVAITVTALLIGACIPQYCTPKRTYQSVDTTVLSE